jgi:hypothetical protein
MEQTHSFRMKPWHYIPLDFQTKNRHLIFKPKTDVWAKKKSRNQILQEDRRDILNRIKMIIVAIKIEYTMF